jgi:hypothetical protein
MNVNNQPETIRKGVTAAYFKALSQHLIKRPSFKSGTSKI